jgi:hypothetical protein
MIQRVSVYSVMTLLVVIIVTALVFIILGYRINAGVITQDALVQFASVPSGASVSVDGKQLGSNTPTKDALAAGEHTFTMTLNNYQPWTKTTKLQAGVLAWLNYALLVPTKLPVSSIENYPTVAASLAAPSGRAMLVQQSASVPTFQIVDLTSDTVKSTTITIPETSYTAPAVGDTQNFSVTEWDPGGRYILVQHTYGTNTEWLVVDTQNVATTSNLSTLYALNMSSVHFAGTSGTTLFSLSGGDIRKIDLSGGTISRALVSNATSFSVYNTNIVTYIGTGKAGTTQRVAGVYRDGDASPTILRTTTSDASIPLLIATTHYFNDDYVAIAEGTKVDILSGSYPSTPTDASSLKTFASYTLTSDVGNLGFSTSGDYAFTQSGNYFTSYSLEYNTYAQTTVTSTPTLSTLEWLTDNDIWSNENGTLTIREVDGANVHAINKAVAGQDATLTANGRFLYSIGTNKNGFQLQRVRMIL